MHIKKYGPDFSRRSFLEKTVKGIGTAGVIAPLWPLIANGADMSKAYPDELLSIEMYTKGKVKPGDVITADNVEHVKDLLDPVKANTQPAWTARFPSVRTQKLRVSITKTRDDISRIWEIEFYKPVAE